MLSLLKKPELLNKDWHYINDRRTISPPYKDLPFIQEYYKYEGQIFPDTMIKEKQAYEIIEIHPLLVILGFVVMVENNLVQHVILKGIHPNRDPDTLMFCLPKHKLNKKFTEDYFDNLITTVKTYYLDNAFMIPQEPKYVKYKKLKSMYIQLNKGDD